MDEKQKTTQTNLNDIPPPKKFSVSDILDKADLSSDFDESVDPGGLHSESFEPKPAGAGKTVSPNKEDGQKEAPVVVAATTASTTSNIVRPASPVAAVSTNSFKRLLQNTYFKYGAAVFGLLLLVGMSVFAGVRFGARPAQMITDQAEIDKSTLLIDSTQRTVGVASTENPDGLQVGATVTTTPQDAANIRMGLLQGKDPSLIFDNGQKSTWQISSLNGALEFIQGTDGRAKLDSNALSLANALNVGGQTNANGGLNVPGETTLGKDSNNIVTIQGTRVATPNNLSFDENTLYINAANNSVSIGSANANGYKLFVAGSVRATGNIVSDGQVLAAAGSARGPSFTFAGNSSSGVFSPGVNAVGIAANGGEVLRVQQGAVVAFGANIEADGYLRGGRAGNNPAFQIVRFTGSLDGSGMANIGTGLGNGYSRVLIADAWYQGGGGAAVPMSVDSVNGGNMVISGGIPGRAFRASILYSQDAAGW